MITAALTLVAVAGLALAAGVVLDTLALVYGSIILALLAVPLLVAGVLRSRPRRRAEPVSGETWSGGASDYPSERVAEGGPEEG